jgi:hypothetical protein
MQTGSRGLELIARFASSAAAAAVLVLLPSICSAQVTPAGGYTPPDDTPTLRVGLTLYPNYTFQTDPKVADADGNVVRKNAFDVSRAYINITGNISHIIAFRLTPDISRETSTVPSLNGSLIYRIKYAFGQFNLDDWVGRGSWVRLGIQQTPWVDFEEGIYRYRFQGTVFSERVPLPTSLSSSDAGASFHYNVAQNIGEIHVGIYNGENYGKTDQLEQKAFQIRGSARPFARMQPVLRGLRVHAFYDGDHYMKNDDRQRVLGSATYEHAYINAGFDYLRARDQLTAAATQVEGKGWSFWATPRKPLANSASLEALIRYDHWTPNTSDAFSTTAPTVPGTTTFNDQEQNRWIIGGAYWFPHQGTVSTAILIDYDGQKLENFTTSPTKVVSVHGLINF